MNKLYEFFSQFGLPAYEENSVPIDAEMPYITYTVQVDEFNRPVSIQASVWYRNTSWEPVENKAMEIYDFVGYSGIVTNGMWVQRGSPFFYTMTDTDKTVKRIVINLEFEFFRS